MSGVLLHLLSAFLIVVASRVPAIGTLGFVALIPSLWALHGTAPRNWLRGSFTLFFTMGCAAYYWIYHVTHTFGGLSPLLSAIAVILFSLISCWNGVAGFTLFGWITNRCHPREGGDLGCATWIPAFARMTPSCKQQLITSVLFATCLTLAWHLIPGIFAWDWSLTLRYQPHLIQAIDRIGTPGLDWLAFAINYQLFCALRHRRARLALPSVIVVAALWSYGAIRIPQIEAQIAAAPTTRVAMIQPNLDSAAKANPRSVNQSLRALEQLTDRAVAQQPHLIVWPEAVFPVDTENIPQLVDHLRTAAQRWNAPLMLGSTHFSADARGTEKIYNSALLIDPASTPLQTYRKHVLLAFGEYIPLEATFPAIRNWLPDRIGAFGRGDGPQTFTANARHFAPVICYESISRRYIRRVAQQSIDFIAEITNDGWYGTTSGVTYHKDLTALRAIENRISVVRTTNTGITTMIDPLGREHGTLPQQIADVSIVDVPKRPSLAESIQPE